MFRRIVITGVTALLSAITASTAPAQDVDFTGAYSLTINGQRSVMQLTQSGKELSGKIDEAKVVGAVVGQQAQVQIIDATSGEAVGAAAMQRVGGDVQVLIGLRDADSGQIVRLPLLTFSPDATQEKPEPQKQQQQQQQQQPQQQTEFASTERDQRLVGRWLYTYTYTGGDFSGVIDTWFILNADGTFQYGGGRAAAGGADSSVVTNKANMQTGRWRTENKTLYVMPDGTGEWLISGSYLVDANNFLLKSGGGKKIFSRQ